MKRCTAQWLSGRTELKPILWVQDPQVLPPLLRGLGRRETWASLATGLLSVLKPGNVILKSPLSFLLDFSSCSSFSPLSLSDLTCPLRPRPDRVTQWSLNEGLLFYFILFLYVFGCTGSYLWHLGSFLVVAHGTPGQGLNPGPLH